MAEYPAPGDSPGSVLLEMTHLLKHEALKLSSRKLDQKSESEGNASSTITSTML